MNAIVTLFKLPQGAPQVETAAPDLRVPSLLLSQAMGGSTVSLAERRRAAIDIACAYIEFAEPRAPTPDELNSRPSIGAIALATLSNSIGQLAALGAAEAGNRSPCGVCSKLLDAVGGGDIDPASQLRAEETGVC